MIIDTHCHPQFSQYDSDRDEVVRRALDAGVYMICVGTDGQTSRQAIALASHYEEVWATVGIHPNDIGEFMEVQDLFDQPKVVAVGEIGLDYYRTTDPRSQERQRELLKQFLVIDKPRIIHCRDGVKLGSGSVDARIDAHQDMLGLLPEGRGVIHSFTGTTQQALLYIERGYHIGLNGIVTFARQYDDVVRAVPLDKMLLETDAPYLAPAPYRGKRNEPVYISEVAKQLAVLKGCDVREIIDRTTQNARDLFGI